MPCRADPLKSIRSLARLPQKGSTILGFRGTTISSIARYPSQGMTSEQQALQREWAEHWTSAKALEAKLQKQEICCLGPVRRHG